MTFWLLLRRSLRFYSRAHLGVVLGAAIGSAALVGALAVGDSVRASLRERAVQRLAGASFALAPPGRLFSQALGEHYYAGRQGTGAFFTAISPNSTVRDSERSPAGAGLLVLPGTASVPSGNSRANHVQVFGVNEGFWRFAQAPKFTRLGKAAVVLNAALAAQLGARENDEVLLRVSQPRHLSLDVAITQHGAANAGLRLTVAGVLEPESGGNLSLRTSGALPLNAFVSYDELALTAGVPGKQNLLLIGPVTQRVRGPSTGFARISAYVRQWYERFFVGHAVVPKPPLATPDEALAFLDAQVRSNLTLADLDLKLDYAAAPSGIELRSPRVFLDPPAVEAALLAGGTNAIPLLTYLANLISCRTSSVPYSMVTAAGPPYTPPDLADDEILVNQWLATDLGLKPGEAVALSYFLPESGANLAEATNRFRVRAVVPLEGLYADRTLMPDFPGIEKAESTSDWDAGFPLVYKIRPQDERYWHERRGTPKAFVSLRAGQKMWGNRFGNLTALRFPATPGVPAAEQRGRFKDRLLATCEPATFGLRFQPVREQALRAANQAQDFGQLFLGFSLFLVAAALLLMALLFQFNLEQRVTELGIFLALGFTPKQVRRLLLFEGGALALAGGVLGAAGGIAYARAMLWGLTTIWRQAVGPAMLQFHVTFSTLVLGGCASTLVALTTLWLTLRKQARRPARELLTGELQSSGARGRSWTRWLALACGLGAGALVGSAVVRGDTANAEVFFEAGALVLIAGLASAAVWLNALGRTPATAHLTFAGLGVRGCARRSKRSLATIALLACGCFVISSISVFHLDASADAARRSSGTGGFALLGDTTLPLTQDLNRSGGKEFFGLDPRSLTGVTVVPFRVHEGDEASCLNLNRAQKPRLLGVKPELLAGRFTFTAVARGHDRRDGWALLHRQNEQTNASQSLAPEVPCIGDANSLEWALGKNVGDTLDYTDEHGQTFKLRLVGALANSVLQGSLLIDEAAFVEKFPAESGYRMLALDVPSNSVAQVSATLSRALQDLGLELTPTVQRLNAFNAVQNTYLETFQVLGGLGLLLGSAGLGVVVLRNVLERRGELAVLLAVGFRRRALQRLVLSEHGALLALGLGLGVLAAAIAVLPSVLSPGTRLPYGWLAVTLAAVLLNGLIWTWLATRHALRGNLLEALRNE